jgi:NAD(P)-dependent dehydrogenase (short-subunit alcohol dehydrogenase family)
MLLINGVTGAIGQSVLKLANHRGISTCGIGRDQEKLQSLAIAFPETRFFSIQDVADEKSATEVLADIKNVIGNVSMYLHAAAFMKKSENPIETELTEFQEAIRTNLEGTFIWDKLITKHMIDTSSPGAILNMSSQAARTGGFGGAVAYAASKGGVETLTRSFARYAAGFDIRVNAIAPGFVENPMMTQGLTPEQHKFFVEKTLLRRFAENDEIARACLFLLSDDASYITAEVIEVSAGQKIG